MVGTGLGAPQPRVQAQAPIVFDGGDEIYLFVKETVAPGGTVGAPVAATGGTGSLTYSLSGSDAASFTINTSTGQILVGQDTSLDYESGKTTYRMVVTATDGSGETASVDVVVSVDNVNEPPKIDTLNILPDSFEVEENSAAGRNIGDPITAVDPEGGSVSYTLTGTNAGLFDVGASSGQIKTKASLDYESASEYTVTFTASDAASNTASIDVTITVKDDSTEAPGRPAKPDVTPNPGNGHKALKVTWVAPDNTGPDIASYVVQYRVDGSNDDWTDVTIVGSGVETILSGLEPSTEYEIQVRAVNDEGQGLWSESGTAETQAPPPPNSRPAFDEDVVTALSVAENTAAETDLGAPITASDPDSEDSLSYSLSGADSSMFSVGASTGQISIGAGTTLDYESPADSDDDNIYSVTVQVTDGRDAQGNTDTTVDATVDVSIRVTNVNEAPEFESSEVGLEIDENTPANANVGKPVQASDPESDNLNYTLSGDDSALFSVDASSGQISVGPSTVLDHESASDSDGDNVYDVTVSVSDGKDAAGNADSAIDSVVAVAITVNDVDEPPAFGVDDVELEVAENTATNTNIGAAITAADPEGEGVTYSLGGSNAGLFDIVSSSGQVKTKSPLNYEATTTYTISFTASDPQSNSASIDLTIKVTDDDTEAPGKPAKPNVVPNPSNGHSALKVTWAEPVNTGPAITGYVVQYKVEGSEGDWSQVTIAAANSETVISSLEPTTAYVVQVRADNDEGKGAWSESGSADTLAAPIVNSEPEFDTSGPVALSIAENSPAETTVGTPITASDSDVQDVLTYSLSGTDSALFAVGESTGQISVGTGTTLDHESPADSGGDNVYELTLSVTDGKDKQGNDDASVDDSVNVNITVTNVNEPPDYGNTSHELEVAENTAGNTDIGNPITATDPESDALSYSLSGADSDLFEVDDSTGQISTGLATLFDHEAPVDADGDNVYELVVGVSDGRDEAGNTDAAVDDTVTVKIEVTDKNEPPLFDSASVELEIPENAAANTNVGEPVQASDPESDVMTYSLVGADSHWFAVDTHGGQIKVKALLDHESALDSDGDNRYEFRLWVSDQKDADGVADSAVDDSIDVTVTVTNRNESPTFNTEAIELEIDENTATNIDIGDPISATDPESDALTYSLAGADSQWFDVDATSGQLRTRSLLDHEAPADDSGNNVYEVTVQVTDGADEEGTSDTSVDDTVSVSITVADVNEPPEFNVSALDLVVVENTEAGAKIGGPVLAVDPDSDTLAYSLSGVDSGYFDIESSTGQISAGASATFDLENPSDANADAVYELTVHVTDSRDINGNRDDSLDAEIVVKIRVTNVNEPPEFDSAALALQIVENLAPGANVGDPIAAADPESATLTYSMSGPDSGLFSIESLSGQVTVGAGTFLDHESPSDSDGDNIYELSIHVTDGADKDGNPDTTVDATLRLTITVADVNEPPAFETSSIELGLAENTKANTSVGDPLAAIDPEADDLAYSLAGADSTPFFIDAMTGQISLGADTALDYESPVDADGDNVYELVVQVADGRDEDGNAENSVDAEISVSVTVVDVNERPAFETPAVSIEIGENTDIDAGVGEPVAANDPESAELVYNLEGVDSALFLIDASSGQIGAGADTILDFESPADSDGDNVYELVVQVADGLDDGGNVDDLVDAEIPVTIYVTDVNEPPEFDGHYVWFDVEENTPALTHFGDPVLAFDPEPGDLTYSLAGDDADFFEFDSSTGLLRVREATALDYETPADSNGDNVYELVAQVSDGTDGAGAPDTSIDDEIGVIISVTNVHEAGEAASLTFQLTILENSPVNSEVGPPIQAEAPDEVELRYSLTGVDASSFDIDPLSGHISTSAEFDYESPADANADNVFEMAVQVTDGVDPEGNDDPSVDDEIDVVIRVVDINEAPGVAEVIRDRTLVESVESEGIDQFDVSAFFRDPDGDELTYETASSDPRIAGVGIAGSTLVVVPAGAGTATIQVTAIDPGQLRTRQSFTVSVVPAPVGTGGFFPIFPPVHQGLGGANGAGTGQANLLSEREAIVVPHFLSMQPAEAARVRAMAFNLLGHALPVGAPGVACTWSSDGGGTFVPNGTGVACTTTFTAPPAGNGTIVVRITQGNVAAVGLGAFEVTATETMTAGLETEATPMIEFPADVTGSVVWRGEGAFVTSPNGLTMAVPAGAIGFDFLGVFIREMPTEAFVVPKKQGFAVGSYAGDFSFTDDAGHPMPGFRTGTPVRICLPFTQEDLGKAVGGVDGVHVVHVTVDGEYFRHPADSDVVSMKTCADVDNFSVYFVGLAVEAPTPTAAPTLTASPTPAPTATPFPTPAPTPTPELDSGPTPDPALGATPVLPVAGDATPGPGVLALVTLSAVMAIATGVVLSGRMRSAKRVSKKGNYIPK